MVHIYEKTCKTETNHYGIIEIKEENPLAKGPCIITILAYPMFLRDINGSLRQVANVVNPDIDKFYDPKRRILGLGFGDYNEKYSRFSRYSPTEEELDEFMTKYFYPLVSKDNSKINVLTAMKNIRNVTFVTYCNGAILFKRIEDKLTQKMVVLGYLKDEIGMILSQICHAAISGSVIKRKETKTLTITFGDVLDIEFNNDKDIIHKTNPTVGSFINYESSLGYGILGDGEHSFKKHMTENDTLSSKIKQFLNASLDNAIDNQENDIIEPITYQKIEDAFNSKITKNK